jgi:predicted AlkP superfamily pyrophosphatase or phosphodiesterase
MSLSLLILSLAVSAVLHAAQPLVVISVDGLDNRYLKNADQLSLKIPNLRKLMRDGQVAKDGVIGVFPTITWPAHTTLITGADPIQHGILGNQKPKSEGGDYYWSASLIRVPTLLQAAEKAGLKSATITWPVTVDAPVTWNLPEYFHKRRGGEMDLRSIESKARPADLVAKIEAAYPSFGQEWVDDRTRTLAAIYLIKTYHPDLLLMHLVDLDSEEHDNGPFSRESNAMLERTDELIGQVMGILPQQYALSITSDHGFEKVERMVNLEWLAKQKGVAGVQARGGLAVAETQAAADFLKGLQINADSGVGREIPRKELERFPSASIKPNAVICFEASEGVMFSNAATGEVVTKPVEIGNHGHWPMRYRSVFILWSPSIQRKILSEFSIKDISGRWATVIGVPWP